MSNPGIPHLSTEQQRQRAESLMVAAYRAGITNTSTRNDTMQRSRPISSWRMPLAVAFVSVLLAACGSTGRPLPDAGNTGISLACGQATVVLQCEAADAEVNRQPACTRSRLNWQTPSGQKRTVNPPVEVGEGRYAAGLACLEGQGHPAHVAIQYAALPEDCKFCEFLFLYDEAGHLLTRSQPLILGSGSEQRPNNQAFDEQLKHLGSPALKWKFLR